MKQFISAAYGEESDFVVEENEEPFIPKFALDTFNMGETLLEMDIDRVSVMLGDRLSAEIVVEACMDLRDRMAAQDYQAVYEVGEALALILKNVTSEDTPEQLTEGIQSNRFRYDSVVTVAETPKENPLLESIEELISVWEIHAEDEGEGTYSEGVEYGYALAAQKLREMLEEHNPKIEQDGEDNENE